MFLMNKYKFYLTDECNNFDKKIYTQYRKIYLARHMNSSKQNKIIQS